MTVTEAIIALQKLQQAGHGALKLVTIYTDKMEHRSMDEVDIGNVKDAWPEDAKHVGNQVVMIDV